ncbi:hypothetical protein Q5752_001482 [Cryptotrichosporon argae]
MTDAHDDADPAEPTEPATPAMLKLLTLDVTSDPVCAFSYLSYKRIQRSLQTLVAKQGPLKVVVRYHPYVLDPDLPEDGLVSRKARLQQVLGDESVPFWRSVMDQGLACGIKLNEDGLIGQTIGAQRILFHALRTLGPAAQYRLLGVMLEQHFDRAHDITNPVFLAKIAALRIPGPDGARALFAHGDEALEWLTSDEGRDDVLVAAWRAREQGINAIPFVIINGKYAICGAKEEEEYLKAFEKAIEGSYT